MSLLRGLAERAMGAARPVRSQRARPVSALHRDESIALRFPAEGAMASNVHAADVEPANPRHPAVPSMGSMPHEPPAAIATAAHIASAAATHPVELKAAPPMRTAGQPERHAKAVQPPPQRNAARPPLPSAHADAPMPDPEPLVTRTAPPPRESPPPRSAHATTPRGERQPARAAAVPAPTEVHVSIGRVELTALPSAPPPRAARPRDSNARGLSDYLRGSRDRS